jgi:hypothetical protein
LEDAAVSSDTGCLGRTGDASATTGSNYGNLVYPFFVKENETMRSPMKEYIEK